MDSRNHYITRRKFLALVISVGAAALLASVEGKEPSSPTLSVGSPRFNTNISYAGNGYVSFYKGPPVPLDVASYNDLPRWRGFNIQEKFTLKGDSPYQEFDFDAIATWGFNFVRLPTDYHIWTPQPGIYLEKPLKEIDQAIEWARERQIYVNLCLHRAPGYCVNLPAEPLNLWIDDSIGEQARQQFADQWRMFGAPYRGIPSAELSFNLINEPDSSVLPAHYVRAMQAAITTIRAEDPERLIAADGLKSANRPVPELVPLQVAQSTHFYKPAGVTSYKAKWTPGSTLWPVPTWPLVTPIGINSYLYGDSSPDLQSPLALKGNFPKDSQVTVHVDTVSNVANLQIRADGNTIFDQSFAPGPGAGDWKKATFHPEWNIYMGLYDRDYSVTLPADTSTIEIELSKGDWMSLTEIDISPYAGAPGNKLVLPVTDDSWAQKQGTFSVNSQGNLTILNQTVLADKKTLWNDAVAPWVEFAKSGTGVHIGEWGAYSQTPHPIVLAWTKDCLDNWKQAGFGWALWNLRGDFGILDSNRPDVTYEHFQTHLLDRQMLELLQQG
jgi:aryl-phospho-beta-D-glucosidase BglC (GH1 family)